MRIWSIQYQSAGIISRLCLLMLVCILSQHALGRCFNVSTASAISARTWSAGDTLLMQEGTWNNQQIVIKGAGSKTHPVVLIARTQGRTVLTGNSNITINGSYIEVNGIRLAGTYTGTANIINFATTADHCRLTESIVEAYNPTDVDKDTKWISLKGIGHRVDHCRFSDKRNIGTLLVVWLDDNSTAPCHQVDHNYFGTRTSLLDEGGKERNGQEIIRIGDSGNSMKSAACVVEDNLFTHCDGEIEIISNKSCDNIYRRNTFHECAGMLTLRHGNRCTVTQNCFLGNNKKGTGGVRIIGENHTVTNNYFDHLTGTNFRSAICIVRGKENSALNEYYQVKNALIANNTMIDCAMAFSINYNSGSQTEPPINSEIISNHIYNTTNNTCVSIDQTDSRMSIRWTNNLMNQGRYSNCTAGSLNITANVDPLIQVVSTTPYPIYEPTAGSGLEAYRTDRPSSIETDLRGRTRPATHLPGCSEIQGNPVQSIACPDNVGPGASSAKTALTDLHAPPVIQIADGTLQVDAPKSPIAVYTLNGHCLTRTQGTCRITLPETHAAYLIRIDNKTQIIIY